MRSYVLITAMTSWRVHNVGWTHVGISCMGLEGVGGERGGG